MNLKKKYPKAWADFEEWYRDTDGRIIDSLSDPNLEVMNIFNGVNSD